MGKLLVICGATATGKTSLAVDCAKMLSSEVISADSQLVYKGLNVGTAKPTIEEMQGIKHYMIDVAEPRDKFSVSDFREMAKPIADRLITEGKIPVICGGTGFYINSLLFDFGYGCVPADENIRKKYERLVVEKGKEHVFELLKERDNKTAEKLHVNDVKRVVRALEIYEVSGKRKSDLNDGNNALYDYLAVAINYQRDELYARIDKRVDEMFEGGLVEEVKALINSGINKDCQCMNAIGYKEVIECLYNGDNESTMRDIIKLNTRHYAKRQITFFKKLPNIVWLEPKEATKERIKRLLDE